MKTYRHEITVVVETNQNITRDEAAQKVNAFLNHGHDDILGGQEALSHDGEDVSEHNSLLELSLIVK